MEATDTDGIECQLDQLERDGYLVIPQALTRELAAHLQSRIRYAREMHWEEGLNAVGNMWFDNLLQKEPQTYSPLVAHESVRPLLKALMGKQCQLRSLRCYVNPGPYRQEWHIDFCGYWDERREAERHRFGVIPRGVNTSFYLQDNDPGEAHLRLVKGGHLEEPPHVSPMDREKFTEWCENQEHIILHPKAGDCVVFLSNLPHRGAKERDGMERSIVVCHYQLAPMHEGIWHLTDPIGYKGTFPFFEKDAHSIGRDTRFAVSRQ